MRALLNPDLLDVGSSCAVIQSTRPLTGSSAAYVTANIAQSSVLLPMPIAGTTPLHPSGIAGVTG